VKHLLLAAVLALAPAPALAEAPAAPAPATPPAATAPAAPAVPAPPRPPLPDANPALWVVRDADTTIYLFGTFHLLDGRPWFNDEVRAAFDASDELVLEAILPDDPASLGPLLLQYAIDPNGRTLSSRLTAEQNAALGRALVAGGMPADAFDRFEPWFAAMTLAVVGAQRLGISGDSGPETILTRAARARAVPIGELEGMEQQIRMLDSIPEPLQLAQLIETLEENDEIAGKLAPMLAAWSAGDVERLAALLNEEEGENGRALHRILFTTRNTNWAGWIQERMSRPGAVFIAVGAGHLAGPDGVQAMLRARGLTATRVPHVATRH
jgi:uncharacterized protein YbaP (TraB family)